MVVELMRVGPGGDLEYLEDLGDVEILYGLMVSTSWSTTPSRDATAFSRRTLILIRAR